MTVRVLLMPLEMLSNHVDLSMKNNSRTQQVILTGEGKEVLEVGPGEGIVASALKDRGCRVFCVEKDPELALKASRFAEEIIIGDIESLDLSQLFRGRLFDVLLFGDVLEHMVDPLRILSSLAMRLKPNGYVVASIPNIGHASARLHLLSGHFDYQNVGLLDRTHVRFFTRKTMHDLFANAGLSIEKCVRIRVDVSKAEMMGIDESKLPSILLDSLEKDPEAMTYQFVVKARHGTTTCVEEWADGNPVSPHEFRIGAVDARITDLENQILLKDSHIEAVDARIKGIEDSLAWRLVRRYRRFNDRCFPSGTRRRAIIERLAVALGTALDEGLRSLFQRVVDRYVRRRKQFFELTRDEQYQVWLSNNELTEEKLLELRREASQFSYQPVISIVMPVYNTEKKWLGIAIDSVINQVYLNWELCIVDDASTRKDVKKILKSYGAKDRRIKVRYLEKNLGISGASDEALTMASGEFVGFLDHDDELTRDALFQVVKVLNQNPNLDLIYSDEDKKDLNDRRVEPFFKPDWSPDLLQSMNYISHFSVMRKSLIDKVGGFRRGFEGSQDYDLILRVTELTDKIGHVQKPLYSWRKVPGSAAASTEAKPYARESAKKALRETLSRRGLLGTVTDGFGGYYRVKYTMQGMPLVSIIIPTRDRVDLLKRCIESIESNTSYKNYEIVIVDNNSTDRATLAYLKSLKHTVMRFEEPFNFSRINNFGAKYAKGEHLLFLNNDTEVVDEHWLDAMLEHSQRPEVGMVGGLLLYPSKGNSGTRKIIQHAGVIIGLGGTANHAFRGLYHDHPNYFGLHRVIRNCSAVTAACAMIRRTVFDEVGGFNENLKVAFGDIDLCLRIRKKGYRVVYTPYAILNHDECATRGKLHPSENEAYMIDKWKGAFIKGDPYYSPNLTLLREDYSLAFKGSTIRPLAVLLDIYYLRQDLQRAYPEARDGDYQRFIDWAATTGITVEAARVPLRPYGSYYAWNTSDRVKPLAILIDLYNRRIDLQRRCPEVLVGEFRALIKWVNEVLIKNLDDEAYAALKPYEASYRLLSA